MDDKARARKFQKLCEINPTLKLLERMCELVHSDHQNSLYRYWYETIKPVAVHNVGNMAQQAELKNSEAYDLAYEHLCRKLGMEG